MNARWIITRFEFNRMARNKAYVIMTLLGPFLLAGISVLPGLLNNQIMSNSAKGAQVALYCPDEALRGQIRPALEAMTLQVDLADDEATALAAVTGNQAKAALLVPAGVDQAGSYRIASMSASDMVLYGMLQGVVERAVMDLRFRSAGLDAELAAQLQRPVKAEIVKLTAEGKAQQADLFALIMTGIGFAMLLYMTLLIYGQHIGRAVVMEKTSKTVDAMLSAVRSLDLMFGKILGIGLAGILQYTIWMVMTFGVLAILGERFSLDLPMSLDPANLFLLLFFFVGGFFLYGSLFAALGAAAEDEQHLGQLIMPLIMLLVIPMVMVSTIIMNPSSPWVVFMSLFPLTSPMTMVMRMTVIVPPLGELLLCIGLLLVTIALAWWVSAKVFRTGILMTGKRHSLPELLRWITAKD